MTKSYHFETDKPFVMCDAEHELMDYYRDNNVFSVYKCETCGYRGIGASVTLHPRSHGPMIREEIQNGSKIS